MTVGSEDLRRSMRAWSSGVTIVTAAYADDVHGMTVNSFTSVSLDPPLVIISLQTGSRTHRLVTGSGAFMVNILSAAQQELSDRFAGRVLPEEERFQGVDTVTLESNAPALRDALVSMDCSVRQEIPVGMNTLFLAEVVAVRGDGAGEPLVYHDRRYRTFA